jgi:hypothetical protein
VALVDIQHTAEYARVLKECGLDDVRRRTSGWVTWQVLLFTWGSVRPCRVTAAKAPAAVRG